MIGTSNPSSSTGTGQGMDALARDLAEVIIHNVIRCFIAAVFMGGVALTAYLFLVSPRLSLVPLLALCLAAALSESRKVAVSDDSPIAVSLALSISLAALVVQG